MKTTRRQQPLTKVKQCGERPNKAFGPFLTDKIADRNGCRQGLEGLRVEIEDRRVLKILATAEVWGPHRPLIVNLDDGSTDGIWIQAWACRLVDSWPITCCSPNQDHP